MKVILLAEVKGTGKIGDVVEISDGHARNFLIPRKLAVEANAKNLNDLQQKQAKIAKQKELDTSNAKAVGEKLKSVTVKVAARGGEGGRLFGAVTTAEIVEALEKQHKIVIEKNKLVQEEPIKNFGTYEVKVKLGHEQSGVIQLQVVPAE
ncbi:MAG: 50S ribosomal protein L9 [Oscillospiraceae bacterium]|nr:50S ribosomal protein L9 [Oscillospiraceae bacterium]